MKTYTGYQTRAIKLGASRGVVRATAILLSLILAKSGCAQVGYQVSGTQYT